MFPFMVQSPTNTFDVIEGNTTLLHKGFDMDMDLLYSSNFHILLSITI